VLEVALIVGIWTKTVSKLTNKMDRKSDWFGFHIYPILGEVTFLVTTAERIQAAAMTMK
jgi:uncharacterized membrane protein